MYSTPYFYVVKHVPTNRLYAGIRTAKGCHPDELLKPNGYKTSSNVVRKIIETEGLHTMKVIYTITQEELGIRVSDYEREFLRMHDAARSLIWLNLSNCVGDSDRSPDSKIREISNRTRRMNVLKKGKKYIVLDTLDNVCYKGHPLYIEEILGITNLINAVANRRKLFDRYEIYPESETFAEHMNKALPMRQKALENSIEGRKNAIEAKLANRLNRLDIYVIVNIYTKEQIEGTLLDLHKMGYPSYQLKEFDRPTSKGKYVMIKKGLDIEAEFKRMMENYKEFKEKLSKTISESSKNQVTTDETREKLSKAMKDKPKKNSKMYEVYKDGVFVRGPSLLPNHAEHLDLKYVTIHCAAKEGRPTKNGYFFKPV